MNKEKMTKIQENQNLLSESDLVTNEDLVEFEETGGTTPTTAATVSIPTAGTLLYLEGNQFGFIKSVITYENSFVVDFSLVITDYTNEGGSIMVSRSFSMLLSAAGLNTFPSTQQLTELQRNLAKKDLFLNVSEAKIVYKVGTRVPSGSSYFYIDSDLNVKTAVEDGLPSGMSFIRFAKSNYFKSSTIASSLISSVSKALQSKEAASGTYK